MIFTDLLDAAGVRHTDAYSERRFREMPFQSLFGLGNLLKEYGVATLGVSLTDRTQLSQLPVPFVAPVTASEWVVVTDVSSGRVKYITEGEEESADAATFNGAWDGTALLVQSDAASCEPDYRKHRFAEQMALLRDVGMWICIGVLFMLLFVGNGVYRHGWSIAAVAVCLLGLTASILLLQKTWGVRSRAADAVCGAIEKEGCDHVLDTGGTFLGIFHWSEVGAAYFSVTLCALLLFPASGCGWLAVANLACLPYTVWSIGYQRFKAHAWCTLCLTVQLSLWLLAASLLWSGWWHTAGWNPMAGCILIVCYIGVTLLLNRITQTRKSHE